jgi:flagellar hook-basal body complex protein FliE
MAGINPISSVPLAGAARPAAKPAAGDSPANFGEALKRYLGGVDRDQQASAAAVQDLIGGKTKDILPAVAAMAKADMSFKLLIGVRNKVIEAYKQTLNMQV